MKFTIPNDGLPSEAVGNAVMGSWQHFPGPVDGQTVKSNATLGLVTEKESEGNVCDEVGFRLNRFFTIRERMEQMRAINCEY